ncbi:interferon gamma 1 [Melanotaenia boesemani]|uniref:interferon gamma 1 n=1 Tax=Melanotaenia boesemani TaxID=1250792 RepID=UPI001C047324|nr:interferon gamma 1 [Melanotaenia boesemani]
MTQKDCRGTTCGVTKVKKTVVCLLLWMSLHLISGSYVPQEMKSAIQNIKQFYKVSDSDIYNNQPVISREVLKSSNAERKMVYMVGILETYEKLIGRMLKQLPTPSPPIAGSNTSGSASSTGSEAASDIRQKLNDILEKVQNVKTTYYQEQEKLLKGLQELKHIQVDNVKVQNKALVELLVLYQEASSLPDSIEKRRKRRWQRQVKAKTNRRG